jgi:mono/diheme cytochrome c family protein
MANFAVLMCLVLILSCSGCGTEDDKARPAVAAPVLQDEIIALPARQSDAAPALSADGEAMFVQYCAGCHDGGDGHPGTMRLAVRLGAENSILRKRSNLAPEYVKIVVRNGFEMMPAFRPTEISDAELDALAAYVSAGYQSP